MYIPVDNTMRVQVVEGRDEVAGYYLRVLLRQSARLAEDLV